jgi:hypothetical protein
MDQITFWIGALLVPVILLMGNALFRHFMDMPQSAGADTGLMFVAFDVAVVLQVEDFKKAVWYPPFAAALTAIYVVMLLIDIGCWAYLVRVENVLDRYHHRLARTGPYPWPETFFSLLLPFTMIVMNLIPFTYGGPYNFVRVLFT